MILFIALYKVVLTFKFVDKTLVCDHSDESYLTVLWTLADRLTVSLTVFLQVVEAVTLIEDSMDKLQQYGEELAETCEKHFPDLKRRVPKFKRRESNSVEKLKNSSQKQVRFPPELNNVNFRLLFNVMCMCISRHVGAIVIFQIVVSTW